MKTLIVGPLLTNCYILSSNNEVVIIDPGGGLKQILKEIGGKIVRFIILTHYHWDHTLVCKKIKENTGAKILIHKEEKKFFKIQADQYLTGGEKIKIGEVILEILHTPGHTRGSICILGQDFIFSGDTVFEDGVGRTDLPGGSEKDLKKSLKKLQKIIKPETKIYPGHGNWFFGKNLLKLKI